MVIRSLVFLLIPFVSLTIRAEELEPVDCPAPLTAAGTSKVSALDKVESQIRQYIREFQTGENRGIELPKQFELDLNTVRSQLQANPMINAPLKGPGVVAEIENIDTDMKKLAKLMDEFDPEKYDPTKQGRLRKLGRALNFVSGDRAKDVLATFRSQEGTIMHILEGLERGRVSLEVANGLIDKEILRLRSKMTHVAEQQELWEKRAEVLDEYAASLKAKIAASNNTSEKRQLSSQYDVVRNEMILPVKQVVQMLDGQYIAFEALVLTHRGQQEQNRLSIGNVHTVAQTAAEVLPAIVNVAANTAEAARVQATTNQAREMMHSGLAAIGKQSEANAKGLVESMKKGGIDQDRVFAFREKMVQVIGIIETGKSEVLTTIEAQKKQFTDKQAQRSLMIDAYVRGDAGRLLGFDETPEDSAANEQIKP